MIKHVKTLKKCICSQYSLQIYTNYFNEIEYYNNFNRNILSYKRKKCAQKPIHKMMAEVESGEKMQSNDDFKDPLGVKDPLSGGLESPTDSAEYEVSFNYICI